MFQFNEAVSRLITHLVEVIPEFDGIDVSRLLVSASFNRSPRQTGLLAYVLPLKFREGSPVETRVDGDRSFHYAMLPFRYEGREILYIIYFMLPRFQDLAWTDKLETIVHELYHISPTFNGDLRRIRGRSSIHGNSLREYDEKIREICHRYLQDFPRHQCTEFLKLNFDQTEQKWGEVVAHHIREPKPRLLKVHHSSAEATEGFPEAPAPECLLKSF